MPRKGKTGRPRAKGHTAKGKARETGIREEAKRAVNPQRADVLSVGGSTGPPSAPRTLSRKGVVSPRPESKGDILRKR